MKILERLIKLKGIPKSRMFVNSIEAVISDTQIEQKKTKRIKFPTASERRKHFHENKPVYVPREPKDLSSDQKTPRLRKSKCAVLFGYCGKGYNGLQINPSFPTIEQELFDAFIKVGAISKENSEDPKKIGLMRASRTDKGVHAAGQVISLKLMLDIPDLIKQIKVYDIIKTIQSFHSMNQCDSREYQYFMPTYCFSSPSLIKSFKTDFESTLEVNQEYVKSKDLPKFTEEQIQEIEKYRVSEEKFNKIRELFSLYLGRHKYHNFTSGRKPNEQACNRNIFSIQVSQPFLYKNREFIKIDLHGQSFMLHQIRKMMAMVILTLRIDSDYKKIFDLAFSDEIINIPTAPALGLLLLRPVFTHYNEKLKTISSDKTPIDFDCYKEQIEDFKKVNIDAVLLDEEIIEYSFAYWLREVDFNIDRHEFLEYPKHVSFKKDH